MPFQGGGMQSCSSLGITSPCWRRGLFCPWHSSALFFSITLGVALAAAQARCKALASFPAEACEVCVKSFLAEPLHFAWLCFASPRFAPHPLFVYHLLIHKQVWGIQLQLGERAAHLRHTKSPCLLVPMSAPFLMYKQLLWHLMNLSSYILEAQQHHALL